MDEDSNIADLNVVHGGLDRPATHTRRWQELAQQVLAGGRLAEDEAIDILSAPDGELMDLLAAAFAVRKRYFGTTVQLYFLMNAKSGLCPEDCSYCSQSSLSTADIPKYNLLNTRELLEGAGQAKELGAKTYCIVISARGPNQREMDALTKVVPQIKDRFDLKICACLGLLSDENARQLKACGVDRVNHNLNTGEAHYKDICSTHSYHDRIETLRAVRDAGLEMCSGGIVGMGESHADLAQMAIELRELGVQSIPVNFLIPIDGTPLAGTDHLNPRQCLKTLVMFRLTNPDREIRIAGGREVHLRTLQPLALYAANSIFIGDYLTTKGQAPESDYQMIRDMGFTVSRDGDPSVAGAPSG